MTTDRAQMADGWRTDHTDGEERVHIPVMLQEVMELLRLQPGDDAIDCTFGGGGYTHAMLEVIAPNGHVLAIDRDPAVIRNARDLAWVRAAGDRITLVHGNFRDLQGIVDRHHIRPPRAIVADLGLSSYQLVDSSRGFSFLREGPLDMRCDPTSNDATAADLLRSLSAPEIERILRTYGEEPAARTIATAIVERRRREPIETTAALAELIAQTVRRRGKIHPATRTFQALRIAVNDELGALEESMPQMLALLAPGGRIAIVTFHSLEDRIVKRQFRAAAHRGTFHLVTRRPLRPTAREVHENPRSRSAKLRVIERLAYPS